MIPIAPNQRAAEAPQQQAGNGGGMVPATMRFVNDVQTLFAGGLNIGDHFAVRFRAHQIFDAVTVQVGATNLANGNEAAYVARIHLPENR
jgi:hypothetical protein